MSKPEAMRKTFVLTILVLVVRLGFSNPTPMMSIISEVYIVNDSTWSIELGSPSRYYYEDTTLNNYQLTTSNGTSRFIDNIPIFFDSILVIGPESLLIPLLINPSGDVIRFERISSNGNDALGWIEFGTQNSRIGSLLPGQSVVNLVAPCFNYAEMVSRYHNFLVKERSPSIGTNLFQATSFKGILSGRVEDKLGHAIPRVKIGNRDNFNQSANACDNLFQGFTTDSAGNFHVERISGKHQIEIFTDNSLLATVSINIEPDSVNYFEFIVDTILTSISTISNKKELELSVFPNPGEKNFTFSLKTSTAMFYPNALIKIYNEKGVIEKILPFRILPDDNNTITWEGPDAETGKSSGLYFCFLEIDGKRHASAKLILVP
jgi:hypothetical protein